MKRALSIVLTVLFLCVGAWCTTVTSVTKIVGPDGQPFNGTITLQLPFAGVNSSTNQLILATPVTASVINGTITQPFAVTGNDLMSPAMPYSALYTDVSGNPVTRQLYYITGATFDVGSAPATPNFLNSTITFANNITATGNVSVGGTLGIKNLEAVRYADQFTGASVGAQIDAACADLAGAFGEVVIPASMAAGWSVNSIPTNCHIQDLRGTGQDNSGASFRDDILDYARYTSVGTGLQLIQPNRFVIDAYRGGVNQFPGGLAQKTQWSLLRGFAWYRTVGEHKTVTMEQNCLGAGDCIGYYNNQNAWGGAGTGGDESGENFTGNLTQGTGNVADFPRGTVASVVGNLVTGTWTAGSNQWLGESSSEDGNRPLLNTSRNVYSTGTIASVSTGSPCTVTGTGTGWTALGTGAKTNLFLEITGNSNGAAKWVVPVASITDDTHLVVTYTLSELGATCFGLTSSSGMTASGTYNIYQGSYVTALSDPPVPMRDPTSVTVTDGTQFLAGDTIQQPLAYNWRTTGVRILQQRLIGQGTQDTGFYSSNIGRPIGSHYRGFGPAVNGMSFGNSGGSVPSTLVNGVNYAIPVTVFINSSDNTAGVQILVELLNAALAPRTFSFDRTNDWFSFAGNSSTIFFNPNVPSMSIGTNPTTLDVYNAFISTANAGMGGTNINYQTVCNNGVFPWQYRIAGVPGAYLKCLGSGVMELAVNNSNTFKLFSGNQSGLTAQMDAATGKFSTYNSQATAGQGVATILGTPVIVTAQTADKAATSIIASATAGEYRVCATARTSSSGTGTTSTLNILWTDEGGAKTDAVGTWALNSITVTGQINKCEFIHAAAASAIQCSTSGGTYGTSQYALSCTAERIN